MLLIIAGFFQENAAFFFTDTRQGINDFARNRHFFVGIFLVFLNGNAVVDLDRRRFHLWRIVLDPDSQRICRRGMRLVDSCAVARKIQSGQLCTVYAGFHFSVRVQRDLKGGNAVLSCFNIPDFLEFALFAAITVQSVLYAVFINAGSVVSDFSFYSNLSVCPCVGRNGQLSDHALLRIDINGNRLHIGFGIGTVARFVDGVYDRRAGEVLLRFRIQNKGERVVLFQFGSLGFLNGNLRILVNKDVANLLDARQIVGSLTGHGDGVIRPALLGSFQIDDLRSGLVNPDVLDIQNSAVAHLIFGIQFDVAIKILGNVKREITVFVGDSLFLAVHDVIHPFEARTVILDAALDGALVFPFLRVALDGSFKNIKLVIDLYREEILIGMIGTVGKAVLKIICSVVGTLRLLNPERRTKVIGGNDFLILDFRLLLRRLRIRLGAFFLRITAVTDLIVVCRSCRLLLIDRRLRLRFFRLRFLRVLNRTQRYIRR